MYNAMRNFDPTLENLMKLTPTDSIRETPPSIYKAHNSWFGVDKVDGNPKRAIKTKGAKS